MQEKLLKIVENIKDKIDFSPEIAIVLGSGLGEYGDKITKIAEIDYKDIDGFPVSTVSGHKGKFIFGEIAGKKVVAMQGRVHFYEGYDMQDVVLPIRIMGLLGASKIILTNAAGGANFDFKPGDLMLISDHISTFVKSPLIGKNFDNLGPRFPDMSDIYNKNLRVKIKNIAKNLDIDIKEGVYMQFSGPNYESPAEIKMARTLGADAVGMSTACEAMVANHMGMDIIGISCITNLAAGMSEQKLSHTEVKETADKVSKIFEKLVTNIIKDVL